MAGISIDIEARTGKSQKDLAALNESIKNIEKTTSKASIALKNTLLSLSTVITSGFALSYIKNVSTEFTNLGNRIATVTGRTKELSVVQQKLFTIAEQTRGTLQGTVGTYASFGRALRDVGVSSENLLKATKSVQEAIAVSGSSTDSANAALIQLGQGLSSGTLRGEELNSVLEQTPRIAQAIADELKVPLGTLRSLAADGKITSQVVFDAILNQSAKINKEFKDLRPTLAQGSGFLQDSIKIFVNELDRGLGLTESMGNNIFNLGKRIRTAAEGAFDLGVQLSYSFNTISNNIFKILKPLGQIFLEIGRQFLLMIPQGVLSNTLKAEFRDSIRILDDATGNWISAFKRFRIVDLFTWDSDIEKAVRKLKRLSPTNWAASGFDVQTFRRVFSTENLNAYAKAFAELAIAIKNNKNSITGVLADIGASTRFFVTSTARYFGLVDDSLFNIKAGNLEVFFKTLAELTRGISGASVYVFQFGKILRTVVDDYVVIFGEAVKDSLIKLLSNLPDIFNAIQKAISKVIIVVVSFLNESKLITSVTDGFNTLPDIFSNLYSSIKNTISLFKEIYQRIETFVYSSVKLLQTFFKALIKSKNIFESLMDSISDSISNLDDVVSDIKDFGEKVIKVFYKIYDKVIGNSYWTDTVENIADTSKDLWKNSKEGIINFSNNFINLFEGIYTKSRDFLRKYFTLISFEDNKIKLPTIDSKSLLDSFVVVFEKIKLTFKKIAEEFPLILKTVFLAASSLFIAYLFPAGALKKVILTELGISLLSSSTFLAEKFGLALTGGSFVYTLGYKLGQAAGFLVKSIVSQIPMIVEELSGLASGFFRGLAEQLPVLGTAFKALFSIFSGLGLAGPLGIVGAVFFGGNILKFIESTGFLGDGLSKILDISRKLSATVIPKLGIISRFFFGKDDPTKLIAGLGLVLQLYGAFDSLFASSPLAKLAVEGGLLYAALTGKEGLEKVADVAKNAIGTSVISPIKDALKDIASKTQAGKTLYDVFFGDVGTWQERASVAIKSTLDNITKKAVDKVSIPVEKGYEFLKKVLLGQDPENTVQRLKNLIFYTFQDIVGRAGELRKKVGDQLGDLFGKVKISSKSSSIDLSGLFTTLSAKIKEFSTSIQTAAGTEGLVGKALFGKYGKAILLASALTLFSTVAFAGEKNTQDQKGFFESLIDKWKSFELENPFTALILQITTISIPLLLTTILLFRRNLNNILGTVFDPAVANRWTAGINNNIDAISKRLNALKLVGLTIGAAGLAGGITYAFTDDPATAIFAAQLASTFALAFRKQLIKALSFSFDLIFKTILGGILRFVLTIKGAIITLLAGIVIFIFDSLFNLDLSGKIKKLYNQAKAAIGLETDKPKSVTTGLTQTSEQFARTQQLGLSFDISGINRERLTKEDTKRLNDSIEKLESTLKLAIDEFEFNGGTVSVDMRDSINALNRGLTNLVPKLESRSALDLGNLGGTLQEIRNLKPITKFENFVIGFDQASKDFDFGIKAARLVLLKSFSSSKEIRKIAAKELKELQGKKDTEYSATFRPLEDIDKELSSLSKRVKELKQPDATLSKEIARLEQEYVKSYTALEKARTSIFGKTKELGENDLSSLIRDILGEGLKEAYLKQIGIDEANRKIAEFTQRLSSVSGNLKKIGAEINIEEVFVVNDEAFKSLEKLSERAKLLEEQLKKTKSIAERNRIVYEITEIRTQILQFKTRAEEAGPDRPQATGALKKNLEGLGIGLFSQSTLNAIADENADRLFKFSNTLKFQAENLTKRPLPNLPSVKPGDNTLLGTIEKYLGLGEKDLQELPLQLRQQVESYQREVKNQFDSVSKLRKDLTDTLLNDPLTRTSAIKDIAAFVGVDFDRVLKDKGFEAAKKGILEILDAKLQLDKTVASGEGLELFPGLSKRIERLKEDLEQPPILFQDLLNSINSLGTTIPIEDIVKVGPEGFKSLVNAGQEINNIDRDLKRLGANATKADIQKIIERRTAQAKTIFDNYVKVLYSTGEKILEGLGRLGFTGFEEISKLPQNLLKELLNIDKASIKLKQELKEASTPERFREILKALADGEKRAKGIKDSLSGLDTRLEVINKAFNLNITPEIAALLGKDVIISLSKEGKSLLDQLDEFNKNPLENNTSTENIVRANTSPVVNSLNDVQLEIRNGLGAVVTAINNAPYDKSTPTLIKTDTPETSPVKVQSRRSLTSFDELARIIEEQKRRTNELKENIAQLNFALSIKNLKLSNLDELTNKITDVFPALADFKSVIRGLSREQLLAFAEAATGIEEFKRLAGLGKLTTKQVEQATETVSTNITAALSKQNFGVEALTKLKSLGVTVEQEAYNLVTSYNDELIKGLAERLRKAIQNRDEILKDPSIPSWVRQQAQNEVNALREGLQTAVAEATKDVRKETKEAGENFAKSIQSGWTASLNEFLTGQITFKDFTKKVFDTFTKQVIQTATDSLMSGLSKSLLSPLKGLGESLVSNFTGLGSSISSGLGSLFGGTTPFVGVYANGGYVKGPGTSTSDSIPSLLSNGEFVVNAKSVKGNLDLLQSINSGKLKRFAEGGLVSSSMITSPKNYTPENLTQVKQNSQQVFNISITGDISRQTRSEIYQMLPSIAEGVNSHNREKGYKR
jgi:tape measure domain-containing protein